LAKITAKKSVFIEESLWNVANKLCGFIESAKYNIALRIIEKNSPDLKKAFSDNRYFHLMFDITKFASLLEGINRIDSLADLSQGIIGRIYKCFPGKFALAESKGKGEFYASKFIIELYKTFLMILINQIEIWSLNRFYNVLLSNLANRGIYDY
jgi:type I restriction-modification system DNA methylase subunit